MTKHLLPTRGVAAWKANWLIPSIAGVCALFSVAGLAQTYELVHAFRNSGQVAPDLVPSQSGLIQAADGYFYGTTYWGGSNGVGTVYRMDLAGNATTIHSFAYGDGANPAAALMQATDGFFYGVATRGGAQNRGVVFRMDSSGRVSRLHSFEGNDGSEPRGALIQANDGQLYGTTYSGGANDYGTVFRITSAGELTTLHSFGGYVDGSRPAAGLVATADGSLYGTTSGGSPTDQGTVFRIETGGSLTTVYAFKGPDGRRPWSGLIQASDGLLYGTTSAGGAVAAGTVFRLDASGNLTTLHSFDEQVDGLFPFSSLVQATDGALYGTTAGNGYGSPYAAGTIFRVALNGEFVTLYNFDAAPVAQPRTSLVQALDGRLYGTTTAAPKLGGQWFVNGAVYRLEDEGAITILHTFGWTDDGAFPAAAVTPAAGKLYGSTAEGGLSNMGTVWRLDEDGSVVTLHSFLGADGAFPRRIIQATSGTLYGSTVLGGWGAGTVFTLSLEGEVTPLHVFGGFAEGSYPSDLIEGSNGRFYGTCQNGGEADSGFIFRISDAEEFTVLAEFDAATSGSNPSAGLLLGADGDFYGTAGGGELSFGTVFRLDDEDHITPLHSFGGFDGAAPRGGLVESEFLFGTTSSGGDTGSGTVFRISPAGEAFATIHDFSLSGGYYPTARLIAASDSEFWGTTLMGGQSMAGVIFRMDHDGNITFLHSLNRFDGFDPASELVQAANGWFYGTARGGPFGDGVVYRLTNASAAVNKVVPSSGPAEAGTVLDVLGGGFQGDVTASVGGIPAADLAILDPTFVYMATPSLNPGTLNDVSITIEGAQVGSATATRANAYFADFTDVPQDSLFHSYVEKIFRKGITAGCMTGSFCPQDAVTRAQMAVFLLKAEHGSTFVPPPCAGLFADVPCPSLFADWVEQLAAEGITAGCGGGNYCPGASVTRAQMAVFLLKAEHGSPYTPPPCAGVFGDVLCPSLFADWIEQLIVEQITAGCGGWNYCPNNPNNRGQMAAFLVKAFRM